MAFLALLPALIAAVATTGTAVAGSVEANNARHQQAIEAEKQRQFSRTQSKMDFDASNSSAATDNLNNADAAQQSQFEKQIGANQAGTQMKTQGLSEAADQIARNLTGAR